MIYDGLAGAQLDYTTVSYTKGLTAGSKANLQHLGVSAIPGN